MYGSVATGRRGVGRRGLGRPKGARALGAEGLAGGSVRGKKRPHVWRGLLSVSIGLVFNGSRQVRELYEIYGPVFEFGITRARITVLTGKEARDLISSRKADAFLKQDPLFSVFEDIMGADYSLPYVEGSHHRKVRTPFNRGLSWSEIEPRWPELDAAIRTNIARLVGEGYSGRASEFFDLVSGKAVADGLGFEVDDDELMVLREAAAAFLRAATRRRPRWTMRTGGFRRKMEVVSQAARRSLERPSTKSPGCPLAQLRELSEQGDPDYPASQLHWHIMVPYFAALETLPATLTGLVFHIFGDDALRKEIVEEAAAGLPEPYSRGSELAERRPLIRSAVREMLRQRPLGYLVEREVIDDFEFEGYSFTAGERILINTTSEHFKPDVFADRFDFDGFRHAGWDEGDVTAFGAGPRRCPGRPLSLLVQLTIVDELAANYDVTVRPSRLAAYWGRLHRDASGFGYQIGISGAGSAHG